MNRFSNATSAIFGKKNGVKKLIFSILLVAIAISVQAKQNHQDSLKFRNFQAIDAFSGEPVTLAHIINESKHVGTISDMLGYFSLPLGTGDTIKITAIGYYEFTLYSWGQFNVDSMLYTLRLTPRVYELKEVKISRFTTYNNFLKEVVGLKLPKSKEQLQIERIHDYFNRTIKRMALLDLPKATSGATFGKDWYMRQYEKLDEHLERERQRRAIDKKYNPGIVSELTGLKGNEIQAFIDYCHFDDKFLLTSTDYEIREKIVERFREYQQSKGGR